MRSVAVAIAGSLSRLVRNRKSVVARNWKVALYVLLILSCVVFAAEKPLKFIYTEF